MTHIVLSDDLSVITAEINSYKQVAGQAVFEIGKRLKHVRDNDLAHGQWIPWLESIEIDRTTATRMIQAYEQFANVATSHHLPTGKIFEMLSLPSSIDRQQFIETPHTIPSTGETKTVDEMTVKELREVKKALQETERRAKEAEARAERAENEAHHWQSVAKAAQNRPPVVQTQTVEVIPPDYQQTKELANRLNTENAQLKRDMMEMRHKYEEQLTAEDHKREARRNLKKACETLLQDISTYTSTILFNYKLIQGDREAYQFLEAFGQQYNMRMQEFFGELKNLTQLRAIK
jgi:Protein of unknown function (DUF3102).